MNELELKWWLAALAGGAGCGLAGFFLLALQVPFLAVCLAHAALAGAVIGLALGWSSPACAFAGALLAAALLGPLADRSRLSREAMAGVLFSLSLGLAFLGIGIMATHRGEALGLMWGNLLLLRWSDVVALAAVATVGGLAAWRWLPQLRAVLFDRHIARASGLPAAAFVYALLAWSGLAVAVNLEAVGGLMLYSLLINPAAAARQLSERFVPALLLSVALAIASATGGLGLAIVCEWPAGASIVLVSSCIFAGATAVKLRHSAF
jgi:manganese/iron transport system permease protein